MYVHMSMYACCCHCINITPHCRVECRIKSIIVPLNEINKTNNAGRVLLTAYHLLLLLSLPLMFVECAYERVLRRQQTATVAIYICM